MDNISEIKCVFHVKDIAKTGYRVISLLADVITDVIIIGLENFAKVCINNI